MNRAASALKAGIVAADALSTVSPRYAREIQTPEQGHGLELLLRARADRLVGITNGVDYSLWNPETDPHIAANFSRVDLSGKRDCKLDLLRRFGLPEDLDRPIIATCGSGVTAALDAFALALLGRGDVSVYDGSWAEWGDCDDVPIATGDP